MSELIGNDPHLMAECGGQQPLDNDSSSDGQPSDNTAGNDNHEHSEETQPHHYHIVPQHSDGDVILECKDRVSFLVSSAVLRVSSRYFRTLFDGNFKEAQIPRSTTNPPRIPLDEKDSDALRRLFCLLHHQRDPDAVQYLIHLAEEKNAHIITAAARRLQDLAAVIDYYECSEPLGRVIDSLLKDFATPSMRGKMTFAATVHVTSAAYMMENAQYFRLFTKRLVTDYSEPLEDADSAETMPERADIIFELDKQSRQMWHRLATEVGQLCKCPCPSASPICITGGKDRLFVEKLKDCLLPPGIAWPTERGEGITLRYLLVDLYGLEGMQRVAWCEKHKIRFHNNVPAVEFRWHCRAIDQSDGLCLACTKRANSATAAADCHCSDAKKQQAKVWVRGDSYRLSTGAAESI